MNARVVGYIAAYVLLDWVSHVHPFQQLAITPWNPPPGLSLFLLLRFGLRYAPALYVAAVLGDLTVLGAGRPAALVLLPPLILAGGYSAVAALLVGPLRIGTRFSTLRDVNLIVVAALVGPAVIAPVYIGLHVVVGALAPSDLGTALLQFWIGDANGIIVTTPLLLIFADRPPRWRDLATRETLLQAAVVLAVLWIVFGIRATDEYRFFYLLFLPLVWIAMRHGIRGAVVASVTIQLGVVAAASTLVSKGVVLREFQFLVLALALTALYLGMTVTERANARQAIAERDQALNRYLRMAAADQISAAIAHELNQPLAAIGNYVRAALRLLQRGDSGPQLRETVVKVEREVSRAAQIVRRLRDFYRKGEAQHTRIAPLALVEAAVDTLRERLARERITVEVDCPVALHPVAGDRVQLELVLHNLLVNSIDALATAAAPGRKIVVVVRENRPGGENRPGEVCFDVSDNGSGIAPEVRDVLFDPFVSTKPEGMGLGLAMSRSIVEAHGGRLTLHGEPGAVTTFRVALPVDRAEDER